MLNFNKRIGLLAGCLNFSVALGLCCSCNGTKEEMSVSEGEVTVQLNVPEWGMTRASGGNLYPVSILLVPENGSQVAKIITTSEGDEFCVSVPNGSYDLYAICGLPAALIRNSVSEQVEIPSGADFAVGSAKVEVSGGVSSPSYLSITAARQMAMLDITLTGVPDNIDRLNLYVKALNETYTIQEGWSVTPEGRSKFTKIPTTRNSGTWSWSGTLAPCADVGGITVAVEATTSGGYTSLMSYTSSKQLTSGKHLELTLAYSGLDTVEGTLGVGGWNTDSDAGTLSGPYSLPVTGRYFSHAATVVYYSASSNSIQIMPHRPMTATLDEVKAWDFKHVPYTMSPEINVQRWAFPASMTSADNIISMICTLEWDGFNARLAADGLTPISRDATDILAYYDKAAQIFYRYDFVNMTYLEAENPSGEYLVYPIGIIPLIE